MLDLFEETRDLSSDELEPRSSCRHKLEDLILDHAARWKQHGKFCAVLEGDENTRFFHARTSQCLHCNTIHVLDINGTVVASHEAKAAALFSYYSRLLVQALEASWAFDIDTLYSGCPQVEGDTLVGPFSTYEVRAAVDAMDRSSVPGPDGLGPSFYRAT
jgi:hypothetical protein